MAKEQLLKGHKSNQSNEDEDTKFNLLEDSEELDINDERGQALIEEFWEAAGQNRGKIIVIIKQSIKDKVSTATDLLHNIFALDEILVRDLSIRRVGKDYFARINRKIDIPLLKQSNLVGEENEWVFYNKKEAIETWEQFMELEIKRIEESVRKATKVVEDFTEGKAYLVKALKNRNF